MKKDEHAKIIITGDFNTEGLPLIQKALKGTNIEPIFPLEEPTHERGGHLDNIFTNLAASEV